MTDPIADMLTRIRNAAAVNKESVMIPGSKQKFALAKLLVSEGWLKHCKEKELPGNKKELVVTLKYIKDKQPIITNVKRISKPSHRVYVKKDDLPIVRSGYGIAVISTSKGLMTNKQAMKASLGGEVICELY